ncbi:hypothetical protein GCM10009101_18100 [Brevundimonas lenta]
MCRPYATQLTYGEARNPFIRRDFLSLGGLLDGRIPAASALTPGDRKTGEDVFAATL